MNHHLRSNARRVAGLVVAGLYSIVTLMPAHAAEDPGWPRYFESSGSKVLVYQPQVDNWKDYSLLTFRSAVAVTPRGDKKEKYGVIVVDMKTETDQQARMVVLSDPQILEVRFPNLPEAEAVELERIVRLVLPKERRVVMSLDRVLAYLDKAPAEQRAVEVSLDPPKIYYSNKPAIMVMFQGQPQLKPVTTDSKLMFAVNTNWDVFFDTATSRYYLLNGESWITSDDPLKGAWAPAKELPQQLYQLPKDDNWSEVRKNIPGKPAKQAPAVFPSTEPAEMIVTQGEPAFNPVPGTKLLQVSNTDSTLFLHSGEGQYYFTVAGRWFRAKTLGGPWSVASKDLPADFANIPDQHPAAFVKASVPGTPEAQDAVLLASVPRTIAIDVSKPVTVNIVYDGAPKYVVIQGTTVQYAVNTPDTVFLVDGGYYWCSQGVWLCGKAANGPWTFCTTVPAAIYTIPPTHPTHNVTYVVVQQSTPTTVVYQSTSGYSSQYVAANGVLMFGMGMLVGAAIADDYHHHYTYGCGAVYHHGYGGYYRAAHYYGPYGGAGRAAAYNPHTGTYARGATAYGPYGSASRGAAYNPYTGARAAGGSVHTAYGSAGRGAAYNPTTGQGAAGRYASGAYGSAGAVRTTEGSGMVAWDTKNSQGAVAKTKSGDVYAAKDGNVYKKDADGGWSQNDGSGWDSVDKPSGTSRPQTTSTTGTGRTGTQPTPSATTSGRTGSAATQDLDRSAQARERGNANTTKASSFSRGSGGFSGGGGGGGRSR